MTRADRRYDACIVGSGAAGSVVAATLAEAGWDVLVVEQGQHVSAGTHLHDLIPTFESARARDLDGNWAETGYPWTACCVGGGTRFYAGVSLRFRHVDFDASEYTATDALDPVWPFGYDALHEHYQWVERRIGVSSDGGGDPFAPAGPVGILEPHVPAPRGAVLSQAGRSLGLRPFAMPLAVNSQPFAGAPACGNLTVCTDHVCPEGAKGDVWRRLLEPSPAVTVRTGLKAIRLLEGSPGVGQFLECLDLQSGEVCRLSASVFIVAGNAIQTSALLLRSTSRRWPDGLGNSSGLVGRGLCMKVAQNVRGYLAEPISPASVPVGRFTTVGITDHYVDESCPGGLGGLLLETNPLEAHEAGDPRLLRMECILADQPMAGNRVWLDHAAPDAYGLPRVVMDYRPHPLDLKRLEFMLDRAADVLRAAGATRVETEPADFTFGSAHLHGTCRMGTDPATSVCAPDGRVHDLDNVYIADGALFPFPGSVNPTLTIQATAHRVATGLIGAMNGRP